MAYYDTVWYVNGTGYNAVALRPRNAAVTVGQIVRQALAPALNGERCYVCVQAGTTADVSDAAWGSNLKSDIITDGTAKWLECAGHTAVNGDKVNSYDWAKVKAGTPSLGMIIKRNNGASYQALTTTAGFLGATEPAFSDVAGATTADSSSVWTCIGPASAFTGGQAPMARLQNAFTVNWADSGDTIFIGHNHVEWNLQTTAMTLGQNNALIPVKVICHNASGPYPPTSPATGAVVATSQGAAINITGQGSFYYYGITFIAGTVSMANAAAILIGSGNAPSTMLTNWYSFENCSFQIGGLGICYIQLGSSSAGTEATIQMNNCTMKFADVQQYVWATISQTTWANTGPVLVSGSSIPTALFRHLSGQFMANVLMEALDLSQLPSLIEAVTATISTTGNYTFKDCKLHPTAAITTPRNSWHTVHLSHSSSDATPYKSSRIVFEGTETTETTIVRTGGYADPTGQQQSRKIATTANSIWQRPYQAQPMNVWNGVGGVARTVTVFGTIQAAALPTTDDIWVEVGYIPPSTAPLGALSKSTKANVWNTEVAPVAADSSAWGGGASGAGWLPFKLVATVPSSEVGQFITRVCVAKPSAIYYVDPQVVVT
jgi:hypothetical protein